MWWFLGIVYVALTAAFIVDVMRNPELTSGAKAMWVLLLILFPVVAWLVYGTLRLRQNRGL
jgi:hypothetical protein